jgi:hypothetical protein
MWSKKHTRFEICKMDTVTSKFALTLFLIFSTSSLPVILYQSTDPFPFISSMKTSAFLALLPVPLQNSNLVGQFANLNLILSLGNFLCYELHLNSLSKILNTNSTCGTGKIFQLGYIKI